MIPKKNRLIKNKDFARVAKQGQAIYTRQIILKQKENNLNYSRFGIVVSLKVDKKSVVRNRIKRRIRAILRENLNQIVPGYDFLIITKKEIKDMDYQEIKEKIFKVFKKKDLIKP